MATRVKDPIKHLKATVEEDVQRAWGMSVDDLVERLGPKLTEAILLAQVLLLCHRMRDFATEAATMLSIQTDLVYWAVQRVQS